MKADFDITDEPRRLPAGVRAETPLVTLAWRALRAEHRRSEARCRRTAAEVAELQEALATLAGEVFRLYRISDTCLPALEQAGRGSEARQLATAGDRLGEGLAAAGVRIVAPQGEPYDAELMELIDNVAQRPVPGAEEPTVAEVLAPAILVRGALLRSGKAVIAVPERAGERRD